MATAVKMPALGQTSDELRVLAWLRSEGESVSEGDPLFEAETDKTTLEVESVVSGTLLKILCEPGDSVEAGTVLAWIGEPGEDIPAREESKEPTGEVASTKSDGGSDGESTHLAERRVGATPAARALAREHGLELIRVVGSGPDGRIDRRDVLEAIATRVDGEEVPKHRLAIARRLERAALVPQFTASRTVDARRSIERARDTEGATLTHVLLQAVASALRGSPTVNRVWVDDGPRFAALGRCDVGLAVAVEDSIIVPTIPEPDQQTLGDLAAVTRQAVEEARAGRLTATYTARASVTLSNLGMYGVDRFAAIVDPDQTAIVAVGRVVERPIMTASNIESVPQLDISLTVDHRTVDGADAGRFLSAICEQLEA